MTAATATTVTTATTTTTNVLFPVIIQFKYSILLIPTTEINANTDKGMPDVTNKQM